MKPLSEINSDLRRTYDNVPELGRLLGPGWRPQLTTYTGAVTALQQRVNRLESDLRQTIVEFDTIAEQPDPVAKLLFAATVRALEGSQPTADLALRDASALSVATQPLIGHLKVVNDTQREQVAAARQAKAEAEYQVAKTQYAIDNAGRYVAPFPRPGEPLSRVAIMFPTDVTAVRKRLATLVAQQVVAQQAAVNLAARQRQCDDWQRELTALLQLDGTLDACRTLIVRLGEDAAAALRDAELAGRMVNESMAKFFRRRFSVEVDAIRCLLS